MICSINGDGTFNVQDSPKLTATDGYCVFEVKASGICGSDIPRIFSNGAYHYPLVIGHEFAGIVKDSTDPELIGKRACIFPILPCGECEFCKKQQWANCTHYDYYGSRRDGGMQSELLMNENNLVFLPDNVSYEAGSMIEPTAVCLHAMKKANITADSSVLIYGAGTIGLLCAMWAKAFGAKKVQFSDPDDRRIDFAKNLGFDAYDGEQVDVVIEASGAPAALNDAIARCRAFGNIVLVGHSPKDVTLGHANFVQILRKQLTLFGSWNSDFTDGENDWKESVQAISDGKLDPEAIITHKVALADFGKAIDLIAGRTEFYNKITVVM